MPIIIGLSVAIFFLLLGYFAFKYLLNGEN